MKHYGDITKINGADVEPVWIITGGSPCQDLSVAGKRAGLAGERSGLFMEQIRIIKEMREHDKSIRRSNELIRPRYMVWENVPGAFSSNGGEDFRAVLEETARVAERDAIIPGLEGKQKWTKSGCIMGDGWSIAWRVHDAQFWGVPQRRKRIALVADFGGQSAAKILFERKSMSGDSEQSREERKDIAADSERSIGKAGKCLNSWDVQSKHIQPENGIAESLYAGECRGGGGESYVMQSRAISFQERAGKPGGGNVPIVLEGNGSRPSHLGDGYAESEIMYTLNSVEQHAALVYGLASFGGYNEKIAGLRASGGDYGGGTENIVVQSVVRRLTPMECERLQGFPDGWTDIGEWVDSKGKKHKDADSQRYKALGNSIALPFWSWMATRMCALLRDNGTRDLTMASLFDGIGGFPLVFKRCGCKPVWASEIEEFPIAVTKIRFPEYD